MTAVLTRTLLEQQVDLMRAVLERRRGMHQHLWARVMPHLNDSAQRAVQDLLEVLSEEDAINPDLVTFLDGAIREIRSAIAAGTHEEQVAIPRDRLFGCDEAFDTRRVLSPAAEALEAALPPLQALSTAARQAFDFAEAVRLSMRLLGQD